MYGELFWGNEKWIHYFEHQRKILCNVLDKYLYSWYYIHVGEEDGDITLENNSKHIYAETGDYEKNFCQDVFVPYIISYNHRQQLEAVDTGQNT